jgi:hypothetical protein
LRWFPGSLIEGVAHEHNIDPGSIQAPSHRGVIVAQYDDSLAAQRSVIVVFKVANWLDRQPKDRVAPDRK